MEFGKIYVFLIILITIGNLFAEQRDMLIFVDKYEQFIPGGERNEGFGAVTGEVMVALYQKAAPILMSASLWHNIAGRLQTSMKNYMVAGTFEQKVKSLFMKVQQQPTLPLTQEEQDLLKQIQQDSYMLAAAVQFNPAEWDFYSVANVYYLLIPHRYKKKLQFRPQPGVVFKDALTQRILTSEELLLGLKVNGLQKITNVFNLKKPRRRIDLDQLLPFYGQVIFVTRDDIPDSALQALYMPSWYFYLAGHAKYSKLDPTFIRHKDDFVHLFQRNKAVMVDALEQLQDGVTMLPKPDLPTKPAMQPIIEEMQEEPKKVATKSFEEALIKGKGRIAGLSLTSFRNLLKFLQQKIDTRFLFYKTCFGGSLHADIPYLRGGVQGVFTYPIALGATTSASIIGELPELGITFGIKGPNIEIMGSLNFNAFFDGLHNPNNDLVDVLNNVALFLGKNGHVINPFNIPLLRSANTQQFYPIYQARQEGPVAHITQTMLNVYRAEDSPFAFVNKEEIIIDPPYIDIPIIIDGIMPTILPMQPSMLFDTLLIQKPDQHINNIFKAFLRTTPAPGEGRHILIDSLHITSPFHHAPETFFDLLEKGLSLKILEAEGDSPYFLRLEKVLILDNEHDILNGVIESRIYFKFGDTYFTATSKALLKDIRKLNSTETVEFKKKYLVMKSYIQQGKKQLQLKPIIEFLKKRAQRI